MSLGQKTKTKIQTLTEMIIKYYKNFHYINMTLREVIISFSILVYLVAGQTKGRCKDVIVGYNTTRLEYTVNTSTGQIDITYGYNLFHLNGSWKGVAVSDNVIDVGRYYVDDSKEKEGICFLHLQHNSDVQANTTFVCLTYTPTEPSANIKGVNGCYNFSGCTQQCGDSNGDIQNEPSLFTFWDYAKIV